MPADPHADVAASSSEVCAHSPDLRIYAECLPVDATAPGHARQEVRRILRSWDLGPSETADAAELVVSELVTNAVVHGTAPVILQCRADRDHFSVTVCDTGSAVEQPCPKTVEPSSEGGRGMLLVDSLTRDLHVETGLLGTTVTATL